jgi:type VI secretion system protein ImpA
MSTPNYAVVERPIPGAEPCGPDLDIEGNPHFVQFMAQAESLLPASFFTYDDEGRSVPFERTAEFKAEYTKLNAQIAPLLNATRDLRLLSLCCRLHALDRNLAACADCLSATAALLTEHWDAVHPRGEDGDFGYRIAVIQALDDAPTMILPLQNLPLFSSRRYGPITLRTAAVTSGSATARAGETTLDPGELKRVLRDADPALIEAATADARRLRAAALSIGETSARAVGGQNAAKLDRLVAIANGIVDFLGGSDTAGPAEAHSDAPNTPNAGPEAPSSTRVPLPPGSVTGFADAAAALAAVIAYFDDCERSSPASLLVRQAARLIGLPFHEVIRILLPNHAEEATIYIGPTPENSFSIRVDRMLADGTSAAQWEVVGDPADAGAPEAAAPHFTAANRSEAIALLRQVGSFYRSREPASPIPLFTDRACAMADKDFLTILSDVLPGVRLARESD